MSFANLVLLNKLQKLEDALIVTGERGNTGDTGETGGKGDRETADDVNCIKSVFKKNYKK